jgi:hypothetical protein
VLSGTPETFAGRYELEISGMTEGIRGTHPQQVRPGEIPTFAMTGTIQVGLRPTDDVAGPIEAVGFARSESGEVLPLSLDEVVRASGKVDVEVPVSALGRAGTWELVFAVGRPDELPVSWNELEDGGTGYEVLRCEVRAMAKPQRSGR